MEQHAALWFWYVLRALLAPGIIAAIVSFAVTYRIKSLADQKLEQTKSLMRQVEEQMKTRFSWLYEARAKSMVDIYDQIIQVDEKVGVFASSRNLEPSETSRDLIVSRLEALNKSIRGLDKFYRPKRLLFSAPMASKLDQLSRKYRSVPEAFEANLDPELWDQEIFSAIDAVASNLPDTESLLRSVETEFRQMYGSEAQ